jgi:hypothetical protein
MLPLTRPVRQTLATVILFGLTVVPTGFIAVVAWRINRPGHVRDVEIELGRQLGLQVTLDAVRYPKPGEVVYQGIVLRQEEPRSKGLIEVARAEVARLQWTDRDLTLHLENPRVRCETPGSGLGQLGLLFQRSGQIPFDRINVSAPTCQVELGREDLTFSLRELAGEFLVDNQAPTLKLAYRLRSESAGTRCEATMTRDRRNEQIQTTVTFKTLEGLPLPARVLNVFFDAEDWFGTAAKVDGTVQLNLQGSGACEIVFAGEVVDIDLARLVGRRFPRHRLTGRARAAIKHARWGQRPAQGAGWVEVQGELSASQGSIGVDLIEALAREMKFRRSPRLANLDSRRTELDYRALGLAFVIEPTGEINFNGALGAEFAPEAVIAGATTPLLSAPLGSASVHGLIKTLFPVTQASSGVLVPHTAESQVLLSLPVSQGPGTAVKRTVDGN